MSQTILVVDDSAAIVKFVSVALKSQGHVVITACDGMEALEKLSTYSEEIALVITDLNMPNLDGYRLIETLRQNQEYRETPIIVLSTEGEDNDIDKAMAAGANTYLVKPFKPGPLLAEVSKYVIPRTITAT